MHHEDHLACDVEVGEATEDVDDDGSVSEGEPGLPHVRPHPHPGARGGDDHRYGFFRKFVQRWLCPESLGCRGDASGESTGLPKIILPAVV